MSLHSLSVTDEGYSREVMCEALAIGGLAYSLGAKRLGISDPNNPEHYRAFQEKMRGDSIRPERFIRERANATTKMLGVVGSFDNSVHNLFKASDAETQKVLIAAALKAAENVGLLIDARTRVRRGADGTEKQSANLIGVHCVGVLARDKENPLLHVHSNYYHYGVNAKGEVYSADMRPFFTPDKNMQSVFQNTFAMHVEDNLGIKMDIEPKNGMARIVGVSAERESNRKVMAQEYLQEKGIEESPLAMAYALKNTRPKKEKIETFDFKRQFEEWRSAEQAKKIETQKVPEQERGLFAKIVDDYLAMPVKVFATAWKMTVSPERKYVFVHNVDEFLKDSKPLSLAKRHQAALSAVRKTRVNSFMHAVSVAEKAFKKAEPKLVIPRGAIIKVNAERVKTVEQWEAIQKRARESGAKVRVYGRREQLKEEEKQSQRQKVGM